MTPEGIPASAVVPPHIPDYELLRLVGRGSYGDVWLARGVTGLFRAIKIVWRARFADPQPYEREFKGLKEFAAVSILEPRQLALLHVGRNDAAGFFYYVMELADDVQTDREINPETYQPNTLREVRARRGRLPANECVALGVELARALAELHTRNLVHRDVKPSNVILVGGATKLADIGLVAAASDALTFVGTEGYVPPEGPGAPSADVFSLGKLLYELATGLDRRDYPRLPADLHALSDRKELLELNEVLIRACEPDARKRHRDATALLDDLLLLQAGRSVRRLRAAERHLSRALRAAAFLGIAATLAVGGAWMEHQRAAKAEAERDALARRTVYAATLAQAQRALEQDNYGLARQFLESVGPRAEKSLAGFEWHALRNAAEGDPCSVLRDSGPSGERAAVSSDNRLLAVHTADKIVTLWDIAAQKEIGRVAGFHRLAGFSEDGRWLLGTDAQFAPRRCALEPTRAPDVGPADAVNRPLATKGNDQLLLFTDDVAAPHRLRLWSFATAKEVWSCAVPFTGGESRGDFYAAAVSRDLRTIAVVLIHGRAQQARWRLLLLDLQSQTLRWDKSLDHRPGALAFDHTGESLAILWSYASELELIRVESGARQWRTKLPINSANSLVTAGEREFVVGGAEPSLLWVDLDTGIPNMRRRGMAANVTALAADEKGSTLFAAGNAGDVRVWHRANFGPVSEISGLWAPAGGGREIALSHDGRFLAATSGPGEIRIADLESGLEQTIAQALAPLAFEPGNPELWVLGANNTCELWQVSPHPQCIRSIALADHPSPLISAKISRFGRWLVSFRSDGYLACTDLASGRQIGAVEKSHDVPWWIALSCDEAWACTSGSDQHLRFWKLPTLEPGPHWALSHPANYAAFAPNGQQIALSSNDGRVEIRELVPPHRAVRRLTSSGRLDAIEWHNTQPRLFVGGQNGALHVFDVNTWQEITLQFTADRQTSPGRLVRTALSEDGRVLAAYFENGAAKIWRSSASQPR